MKKAKKILLWTSIGLGTLITIILVLDIYFNWTTRKPLEAWLSQLRQFGDPLCLADLARKPSLPEQNGAIYLHRAEDDLTALGKELGINIWGMADKEYSPDEINKIKDAFDAFPKVYPLLEQAAACDEIGPHLDFTLGPKELQQQIVKEYFPVFLIIRQAGRYIECRVAVLIAHEQTDEALRSSILLMQLGRRMGCPQFINQYFASLALEGMALDCTNKALQSGPVSDKLRKDLNRVLLLNDPIEKYILMIKGQRAYELDFIRHKYFSPWLTFGRRNQIQLDVLHVFMASLDCIDKPYSFSAYKDRETPSKPSPKFEIDFLRTMCRSALRVTYRNLALNRSLRIINALQGNVPPGSDHVPTMAELGLPEEVGIDPYNGEAMHIKKLPQGWLVYSVGENLKDDGGKWGLFYNESLHKNEFLDVGFGPKIPAAEEKEKEPAK
jgi:hypothetical protein